MVPLISLFWTSGDVPLGFEARVGSLFTLGGGVHVTPSLILTSGVGPAKLLVASMAAEPSLPHTCKELLGLETGSYHAAAHSVRQENGILHNITSNNRKSGVNVVNLGNRF